MLIHAITWEKCEYIMLSETSQSQKDSTVRFHLCQVSRTGKSTWLESRMVVAKIGTEGKTGVVISWVQSFSAATTHKGSGECKYAEFYQHVCLGMVKKGARAVTQKVRLQPTRPASHTAACRRPDCSTSILLPADSLGKAAVEDNLDVGPRSSVLEGALTYGFGLSQSWSL